MFEMESRPRVKRSFGRHLMCFLYTTPVSFSIVLFIFGMAAATIALSYQGFTLPEAKTTFSVIMGGTVFGIFFYNVLRPWLGEKYLIVVPWSADDFNNTRFLIRTKDGKVVEVSNDILWQSDFVGPDDKYGEIMLDRFNLKEALQARVGNFTVQVPFEMNLNGQQPATSWQQIYNVVIKKHACDRQLIGYFFQKQLEAQIQLHQPETVLLFEEYVQGKIKKNELLRRLANNLNGWNVCPDLPDLRLNFFFPNIVKVEDTKDDEEKNRTLLKKLRQADDAIDALATEHP